MPGDSGQVELRRKGVCRSVQEQTKEEPNSGKQTRVTGSDSGKGGSTGFVGEEERTAGKYGGDKRGLMMREGSNESVACACLKECQADEEPAMNVMKAGVGCHTAATAGFWSPSKKGETGRNGRGGDRPSPEQMECKAWTCTVGQGEQKIKRVKRPLEIGRAGRD